MEFEKLLVLINKKELMENINELLEKKKSGIEMGLEPKRIIINDFVNEQLLHFENAINSFDPKKKPNQGKLEDGFIRIWEHVYRD